LDPIDGTKGFIRGEHFCVALALAVDGRPVQGVLGCPNLPLTPQKDAGAALGEGVIFFAREGAGAFMLPLQPRYVALNSFCSLRVAIIANGRMCSTHSSAALTLEEEVKNAERVTVSEVTSLAESRFCESVEAAHSPHDQTQKVAAGKG
jgi:3'(2'), 5'-bisphosphate nucleotidase